MLFVPPGIPFMVPEAEADHVNYATTDFISPSDWATSCESNSNDCRLSPIDQGDSIVFDIHYKPRVPIPFPIQSFDIWIDYDHDLDSVQGFSPPASFSWDDDYQHTLQTEKYSRWVHTNWQYQEQTADPTVPLDYSNPTCVSGNTQPGFRGTTPYWSPPSNTVYENSNCSGVNVEMINHDVYRITISGLTDGQHEVVVQGNKLNTWGAQGAVMVLTVGDADTTPPVVTVPDDMTFSTSDPDGWIDITFDTDANDDGNTANINTGTYCDEDSNAYWQWQSNGWSHPSGFLRTEHSGMFPVGTTVVTCYSSDIYGNTGTASFTITLVNTAATPPTGTFTITDGTNGGDCTSIGTWDSGSKTCNVTTDINGGIIVGSHNITLDGNSSEFTGWISDSDCIPSCSYNISVYNKNNIAIKLSGRGNNSSYKSIALPKSSGASAYG